jgi:RNA polymerase sigma-70 factor (ECF subfamily)
MAVETNPYGDKSNLMETLIHQHGDSLLRLCFMYLGDRAMAEDALQDTFIKAYRALDKFRGDSSYKTWLTRIAVNVCKSIRRSAWMRHVDRNKSLDNLPAGDVPFEMADDTVIRAVMSLPEHQRTVILLYFYQGFRVPEIAQLLSVPVSTVSSQLQRGKARLKNDLKGWYYDEEDLP